MMKSAGSLLPRIGSVGRRVIVLALVAVAAGAGGSGADDETTSPTGSAIVEKLLDSAPTKPTGEVTFSADRLERIDEPTGPVYSVQGNVRVADDTAELRCDRATYRQEQQTVEAAGDVTLTQPDVVLEADRIKYDFGQRTGRLDNVRCEMPPFYITATELVQAGPDEGHVEQLTVTTCDLPEPHYRVSAPAAEFRYGTELVLHGAVVWLGPVPIFYWPRYTYVVGELRPHLEFDAGRESHIGEFVRLAYNFSPVEDLALTLRTDAYTKAGYGFGLDGEFDVFKPDLDETAETDGQGGHGEFRTYIAKDERGRAEGYYRHEFPADWVARMQVEHWSDPEFLKQFYYDEYKRRTEPSSFVNVTKTWDDAVLSLTARKQVTGFIEDVNRLPEARFTLLDRPLLSDTLLVGLDETVGYLDHRPHGPHTARNRTAARVAVTGLSRPGLSVVPFIEGTDTWYSRGPDGRDNRSTGSYEAGIAAGSRLHRTYGSFLADYTAFKHVVMPTVTVSYRSSPTLDPDDRFAFDPLDEAYRLGRVSLEFDNRLLGRTEDGSQRELVRWTLYGGSDFASPYRTTRDWESWLDIYLTDRLTLTSSVATHRGEEDFTWADVGLRFGSITGPRTFEIGYDYEEVETETINKDLRLEFATALGEKYKVRIEGRYDFEDSRLEYQQYSIERDMHCFTGGIAYRKRRSSTDVYAVISLKAFPHSRLKF